MRLVVLDELCQLFRSEWIMHTSTIPQDAKNTRECSLIKWLPHETVLNLESSTYFLPVTSTYYCLLCVRTSFYAVDCTNSSSINRLHRSIFMWWNIIRIELTMRREGELIGCDWWYSTNCVNFFVLNEQCPGHCRKENLIRKKEKCMCPKDPY